MINRNEFLNEIGKEYRLRTVLRNLLKEYVKEKEKNKILEESRIRKVIKLLINELSADVANEQPQRSTGINALRALLKNIIPTVEESYKELTTSKEQRESFRAHILNAIENSLKPAALNLAIPDKELEEEIDLDVEVEEDKFIPARPEDEEVAVDEEAEDDKSFEELTGMNITGRNFAATTFNKIEKQILSAYEDISGDKKDRDEFKDYLITNFKLYFDRFEEELSANLTEPESPDYQATGADESEDVEAVDLEADLEGL